jgi:hypothetical protein
MISHSSDVKLFTHSRSKCQVLLCRGGIHKPMVNLTFLFFEPIGAMKKQQYSCLRTTSLTK